jgi:dTDP-4-amino-4,6-dideoxygalactose transaminase
MTVNLDTAAVPLVDLAWQRDVICDDVRTGWDDLLARTTFIGGPEVAAFEREYASYLDVSHVVGTANGTDALEVALRALGVGPGDDVVVPANTFIATAEAVRRAGARAVFADVDDETLLLDPASVEAVLTTATRAIMPVHLYGQMAPIEALLPIAERAGAVLVEDAAQSQGARRHGRHAGTWGAAAGTSFYPGKNLGAFGDAGAVMTADDHVAHLARLLTQHGSIAKYRHDSFGFNSRLDSLQAVVLRAKLRHLDAWNTLRREAAARYDSLLEVLPEVRRPATAPGNDHVWHLYVVRVPGRARVLEQLNRAGIGASVHYPMAVHLTAPFVDEGDGPGSCPVAERAVEEILTLPLYPGITVQQQERVVDVLDAALRGRARLA